MNSVRTRVVVAEDEFMVTEVIKHLLASAGCDVVGCAPDGRRTVELVRRTRPDVVIMDIRMPDMDGLEAAKRIRSECPTPVIVLTAYESDELLSRACEAGVSSYLLKMPRVNDLERAIAIARARFLDLVEITEVNKAIGERLNESERETKRLSALVAEIKTLLHDVHHRMKNNMLFLSSYLGIMKRNSESSIQRVIGEAQNHIRSMMRIYDRLYRSGNYSSVGIQRYLQHVVRDVSSVDGAVSGEIEIRTCVEDCEMDTRSAMFMALIVNESITNCLKHAFGGRNDGIISIEFRRLDDRNAELVVSDNGAGCGDEVIGEASAFLNLKMLVESIDGELHTTVCGGLIQRVTFPLG
jgi:two-component sensor histidine kinase